MTQSSIHPFDRNYNFKLQVVSLKYFCALSFCVPQLAALRHEIELRMRKSVKEGQTVSSEVVHILILSLNKVFFFLQCFMK